MDSGRLHLFPGLPSAPEGFTRTVRVWLPDAYQTSPGERFPVLYLQDGQNVFTHPSSAPVHPWGVERTLTDLAREGLGTWMAVGVDSGPGRLAEYSPFDEPALDIRARGEPYLRFLSEQLKPWVDAHFRTRPGPGHTAVAGSSMGGLISLWLGYTRPERFSRVAALSPTAMWGSGELFRRLRHLPASPLRLYLDAGAREHLSIGGMELDYGRAAGDLHAHLTALGYPRDFLRLVLEPGGEHHERDWQRRLPAALRWLLA
jgi:predicted alpha/beta superfamily hydrolase